MSAIMKIHELGLIDYQVAYETQVQIRTEIKSDQTTPFHLVFCQHERVLTLGRSFHEDSMPFDESYYINQGFKIIKVDRGGDITFHGPGQLTVYFIFDLNQLEIGRDVHKFIRNLEEVVIKTLGYFNIEGSRLDGMTGVWVGDKKVCALGVGFKHWISYHGIGLNVDTDLANYKDFIPCGLKDKKVGNLNDLVDVPVTIESVKEQIINSTLEVFDFHQTQENRLEKTNI